MDTIPSSAVIVRDYRHRTGEHCASTALRNLLAHQETSLSEGMIFGLASGLGFFYLESDSLSPTRMFHGRTATLEQDFAENTGLPLKDRMEPDDSVAWQELRDSIDRGLPVMVSTDTFYLGYHNTTSHFPGHRCVVVGYDDAQEQVYIADRKFDAYQVCSYEELRCARNAPDYPMSSQNQFGDASGPLRFGRPLAEAVPVALARNARAMLEPHLAPNSEAQLSALGAVPLGIPGMRKLAADLGSWRELEDWSWAARFGYQVVVKRGAAGTFFRSLLADFLRESAPLVPGLAQAAPAADMDEIAARWCDLAVPLKEQSEREDCAPALFEEAGRIASDLAGREERFFTRALQFLS